MATSDEKISFSDRQFTVKKGRGAVTNHTGRYESEKTIEFDDGWGSLKDLPEAIATVLSVDSARTVITYNQSPDVPYDRSINPYRGCEHGCVYCFARPSHAYLGLSTGLDFETKLFVKAGAEELLSAELSAVDYIPAPIALGINTDAYQPVERKTGMTRKLLKVLQQSKHPVSIVTKSSLIERDIDLLADMSVQNLVHVTLSITTLKSQLSRKMEPRAPAPKRRLETLSLLSDAGIPVSVLIAPLIPMLNDEELEKIMSAARELGALDAGYVLLRLPLELKDQFQEWLFVHEPLKSKRIMNRIYDARGGKAYDSAFGLRMTGTGEYAGLIKQRFHLAKKKLAFPGMPPFNNTDFKKPEASAVQTDLFDFDCLHHSG